MRPNALICRAFFVSNSPPTCLQPAYLETLICRPRSQNTCRHNETLLRIILLCGNTARPRGWQAPAPPGRSVWSKIVECARRGLMPRVAASDGSGRAIVLGQYLYTIPPQSEQRARA